MRSARNRRPLPSNRAATLEPIARTSQGSFRDCRARRRVARALRKRCERQPIADSTRRFVTRGRGAIHHEVIGAPGMTPNPRWPSSIVIAMGRSNLDRMIDNARSTKPFVVSFRDDILKLSLTDRNASKALYDGPKRVDVLGSLQLPMDVSILAAPFFETMATQQGTSLPDSATKYIPVGSTRILAFARIPTAEGRAPVAKLQVLLRIPILHAIVASFGVLEPVKDATWGYVFRKH